MTEQEKFAIFNQLILNSTKPTGLSPLELKDKLNKLKNKIK